MERREFLRFSALIGGASLLGTSVMQSDLYAKDIYPSQKIVWMCHTQPGSGYDIIPRVIGPYMQKYLQELSPGSKGGAFVIKNDPAAAGLKAYSTVYKAAPNGYIIGGMDMSFVTDVILGKLDFEIEKLTYLAKFNSTNKLLVTSKNGFKSWKEAVEASHKAPLKISVGQFGRANHIAGILLQEAFGLNIKFIATSSTSANMNSVMRGDVHCGIAADDSINNLIESKEVRPILAFFDTNKYPEAVTLKNLGYPDVGKNSAGHRFAIAPPGLPKYIRELLIGALKKTMEDKELKAWAVKTNYEFTPVYGDDATEMAYKYIQFYKGMEPTLKKYLL